MEQRAEHWDEVFGRRADEALTWFEAEPAVSWELLSPHCRPGVAVIDVGGGTCRLVDRLLAERLGPVSVLDVSAAALKSSQARLGPRAAEVTWIVADITRWRPDRTYGVWHDRAVFHFLTDPADRAAYVATMDATLTPGGVAVIATFAEDGPTSCSGLPVQRYSPEALAEALTTLAPGRFEAVESRRHVHVTPKGNRQSFQISVFRKTGAAGR